MNFQKFQNRQKLHFDQKLRLRRYLAQPHVHVLKAPYAVVLSYDFRSKKKRRHFGWVGGLTPRLPSDSQNQPKTNFLMNFQKIQNVVKLNAD